jgi:hypothetical protein
MTPPIDHIFPLFRFLCGFLCCHNVPFPSFFIYLFIHFSGAGVVHRLHSLFSYLSQSGNIKTQTSTYLWGSLSHFHGIMFPLILINLHTKHDVVLCLQLVQLFFSCRALPQIPVTYVIPFYSFNSTRYTRYTILFIISTYQLYYLN